MRTIVTNEPETLIEDLMDEDVIYVHTDDDQETVADVFKKYGFVVLPVVDNEKRLTGIITVDDIMEVMEQEATEDFQIMAGMSPDEDDYLDQSVFNLAKKRIAWLLILMISATFTGSIMTHYESLLGQAIILTAFIPMIMDTGGNSGSQSSTLIISGLATGEISTKDWLKVFFKEFRVALVVSVVMSIVCFIKTMVVDKVSVPIGLVVSLTLIFTIVTAKLIGGMLPIIAKKLKLDPAIMAGPLITTVVDALSLLIYFEMAHIALGI